MDSHGSLNVPKINLLEKGFPLLLGHLPTAACRPFEQSQLSTMVTTIMCYNGITINNKIRVCLVKLIEWLNDLVFD